MKRRGSVPLLVGSLGATLIGGVGVMVDVGRAWLVEARVQSAIDAAGLAAARRMSEPNVQTEARQIFWANLTQGGRPARFLGASISEPTVTLEPNPTHPERVRVQGSATVPLTLGALLGSRTLTVSHTAVARRAASGLEVAIVMDVSGSMIGPKLDAAKAATRTMLDIIYGGPDVERGQNIFVSFVPTAADVNIGTVNSHMLQTGAVPALGLPALTSDNGWSLSRWNGCVEARLPAFELTDDPPIGAARFRPYFWPSTFAQVGSIESGRCTSLNAYLALTGPNYCHGDNDWWDYSTRTLRTHMQNIQNDHYHRVRTWTPGGPDDVRRGTGPNHLCMKTPLLPLTARRSAVNAYLDLVGTTPGAIAVNGSNFSPGLQAAWHTLSPRWRGFWQDTNAGLPDVPPLPLDYNLPFRRKAIVFLSDGVSSWLFPYGMPWSNGDDRQRFDCGPALELATPTTRGVCPTATGYEMNYTAYGRVADWNTRFPAQQITRSAPGAMQSQAGQRLNERLLATCAAIKATGIEIYVVGFEVGNNAGARSRLQTCATSNDHYFEAPTAADLQRAFSRVGSQLGNLVLEH